MPIGTTSTGTALKDMVVVGMGQWHRYSHNREGQSGETTAARKITEGQKRHESALPWCGATTLTWKT